MHAITLLCLLLLLTAWVPSYAKKSKKPTKKACNVIKKNADLTHTLDESAPKFPLQTIKPPMTHEDYYKRTLIREGYISCQEGIWFSLGKVQFFELMGTHLTAPCFSSRHGPCMDEIPTERLIGPAVIINITGKAKQNNNYAVTVADLEEYELKYGEIQDNSIVIMKSGWYKKYPDPYEVYGSCNVDDVLSFNYPGFSPAACMFLYQRNVAIVGSDTPAIDPGQPVLEVPEEFPFRGYRWPCDAYLFPLQVPTLHYLANLDKVPESGTTIFVGGMKHRGGRAGPARVIAVWEEGDCKPESDDSRSDDSNQSEKNEESKESEQSNGSEEN